MIAAIGLAWTLLGTFCTCAQSANVFVMLPLDVVTNSGDLKDPNGLKKQLQQLKSGNVDGIMTDVWWGITEQSPKAYKFDAYKAIVGMCKDLGLKMQIVTSFHMCGGGVGDTCNIPVPGFVSQQSDIWYKDQHGHEYKGYISLFADNMSISGRIPLQMYSDWFQAFADTFSSDIGSVIEEIQVGMGPAGELRYPAYQLSQWKFCGVGAFQAYDKNALASLQAAANLANHSEWSHPPSDAGDYNSLPNNTPFFQTGYQSEYGKFFLTWYSDALLKHSHEVLSRAKVAFSKFNVKIAGKVAGIHWWYKSPHHAAELTTGYYNTNNNDVYGSIAKMFSSSANAGFDFTCMEMADSEQPSVCECGPEELVKQVISAVKSNGNALGGENALQRYDDTAFAKIESYKGDLQDFTYLRLDDTLLSDYIWGQFKNFVNQMHNGAETTKKTIVV